MLENLDKIIHLRFNFDACPMHSPFGFVHLTHQNLSARALFCLNSLAKVNTQLLIYNSNAKTEWVFEKLTAFQGSHFGCEGEAKIVVVVVVYEGESVGELMRFEWRSLGVGVLGGVGVWMGEWVWTSGIFYMVKLTISMNIVCLRGIAPLTQNKHVLCSISNSQHLCEKWYMHLIVNCPRNSKIASKFG